MFGEGSEEVIVISILAKFPRILLFHGRGSGTPPFLKSEALGLLTSGRTNVESDILDANGSLSKSFRNVCPLTLA